jgi:hypothetical protein
MLKSEAAKKGPGFLTIYGHGLSGFQQAEIS